MTEHLRMLKKAIGGPDFSRAEIRNGALHVLDRILQSWHQDLQALLRLFDYILTTIGALKYLRLSPYVNFSTNVFPIWLFIQYISF